MTDISQPEEAVVQIDNYAGTLTNVETMIQTAGLSIEYDTDDAISLADDHEDHTLGAKDPGNFDNDAVYTRAWANLCIAAWRAPNRKTYQAMFRPEGTGTGLEEYNFNTFMTGFEMSCDDGSTSTLNRKNKITGEIVKSAQA